MKEYQIYIEPDPTGNYRKIKDIYEYTLLIDKDKKEIFVNYLVSSTMPCMSHCVQNTYIIKEKFSLEDFFRLKQCKKYKSLSKVKKILVEKLIEIMI